MPREQDADPYRMAKWGIQKVSHVVPMLEALQPDLTAICTLLEHHLIQPIVRGETLTITTINGGVDGGTLLSRVEAAVEHSPDSDADGKSI